MKTIRQKKDIVYFLENFSSLADKDEQGNKWYFVFDDYVKDGILTVMKYTDDTWTVHGKGSGRGNAYCDDNETILTKEDVALTIWKNRKAVNQRLKEKLLI